MTFGMVVTLRVRPGFDAEFCATMSELAAVVCASEPDTRVYLPLKVRDQPDTYVVMEFYESEAAHDVHLRNPCAQPYFARLADLIAERISVLSLDPIDKLPVMG